MANERTESATPKRRNQARKKGQIAKSQDFNYAIMLSVGLYLLYLYMPFIINRFKFITIHTFSNLDPNLIDRENLTGFLFPYLSLMFLILLPILMPLLACGVLLNYFQIGPLFTLETIKPDFSKLSPIGILNGFKKFFNLKSLVELGKSFVKMLIIGSVAYSVIDSRKNDIMSLLGADLQFILEIIGSIIFQMFTQICIILIIIGIIDKKYQNYEFEKSIKMTKEDVKDERKNAEGDPQIKAKIRNVQMRFALQRMMSAIPSANVVIKNPTHYAVALRYDAKIAPAPQIVAKGVDFVAFKILEVAKNNNSPIIENKPLARTLYKIVPLDGLIPAELFVAVAEVLAYVYKINKKVI
ncbi:MAG: flagellar biosynthesis protein FlhB [bacterium]